MKTISNSSIDLRITTPNQYTSNAKSNESGDGYNAPRILNMRDAIRLNDQVRIRKGSPGSHSQGKTGSGGITFMIGGGADSYKTLDQTNHA